MNKRERDGSGRPKSFIGRGRSGLHDTYVEDSSMSRSVSNEVHNEHTAKRYLGLQVAYKRTMRLGMLDRTELINES
jgi:hypothetical protein